jgi:hypothetical protein
VLHEVPDNLFVAQFIGRRHAFDLVTGQAIGRT